MFQDVDRDLNYPKFGGATDAVNYGGDPSIVIDRCATCHGISGNGNGLVHIRAASLGEGTWTPPTDLTSQTVVDRPVGYIYNSIKNGIRNMPAYGPQIDIEDRWAIVAYVRALQLSRNATVEDLPDAERAALQK